MTHRLPVLLFLNFMLLLFSNTGHARSIYAIQDSINKNAVIFMSPLTNRYAHVPLMIVKPNGDTLQIKHANSLITNFNRWKYDGKVRYSYFLADSSFYKMKDAGYSPGYQIITDTAFNEIKRFTLQPYGNINVQKQRGLDNHEFILLSDNHYIALSYYEVAVNNIPKHIPPPPNNLVIAPVIQEVKNDKVIWQWVGTDYPELYESSFHANDSGVTTLDSDYLHVNSIFIDTTDNNLIISCRNANQILKLNRNGNGIIWKLGGYDSDFDIPAASLPIRQHHATKISPNTILLFDNGSSKQRKETRITEFTINEKKKKLLNARHTPVRLDFVEFGGSVQRFENLYFINGGNANFMIEVEVERTRVLSYKRYASGSYRAIKYVD